MKKGKLLKSISCILVVVLLGIMLAGCSQSKEASATPSEAEKVTETKSSFPEKSITVIIPFAPGGSTDQFMRPFVEVAKQYSKAPFVMVNKVGAGGVIGTTELKKSPADGYTISFTSSGPMCTQPNMVDVEYDTATDFEFINGVIFLPVALMVRADSPYQTLEDLILAGQKKTLTWASAGVGTVSHLAGELFMKDKGMKANLIPTPSGGAEALTNLLGGHVEFTIGHVVDGVANPDVKFLSIFSEERDSKIPETPTMKELGFEGMVLGVSKGFIAPKGTPEEAINFIDDISKKVMQDAKFIELTEKLSLGTKYESGAAYKEKSLRDLETYKELIDSLGIKSKK